MTMGEVGKKRLQESLRNKRASEGLDDIPHDELFAKKPRHELTEDEKEKVEERRKRNKEAAEKSRKKKKDEFEKLQMENEQLNQDKCEMAAMIEKLKSDVFSLSKMNKMLQIQNDQIKKWVAKKSSELGLAKHTVREREKARDKSVLRGDPSLHSVTTPPPSDDQAPRVDSPASSILSASPPPASSTPPPSEFQPVGIRTSRHSSLLTPWSVDTPTPSEQHHDTDDVIFTGITPPQSPQASVQPRKEQGQDIQRQAQSPTLAQSQAQAQSQVQAQSQAQVRSLAQDPRQVQSPVQATQMLEYYPKDTFFIVQGEEGSQYLTPLVHHQPLTTLTLGGQQVVMAPPLATPLSLTAPVAQSVAQPIAMPVSFATPVTQSIPQPLATPISLPPQPFVQTIFQPQTSSPPPQLQTVEMPRHVAEERDVMSTDDQTQVKVTASDPSVATAIDSLLKLGYRIHRPWGRGEGVEATDDGDVVNVPQDAPESAGTVTITTTNTNNQRSH